MKKEANRPPVQQLQGAILDAAGVMLSVLRLDQVHSAIAGNKWYKLKYNLKQAQQEGHSTLLTFGGAYSNHIHATAVAGKACGFQTIGVIRGERPPSLNPTLHFAQKQGMQLHFVSREAYREKADKSFIEDLQQQFGAFYLLPEGGSNALAVKGCAEILPDTHEFDVVGCSMGTGGTLAGLLVQLAGAKQVLGFPALKGGDFLQAEVNELTQAYCQRTFSNYQLMTDYHFGGYAKANRKLVDFINNFYQTHRLPLDPVYNGKLFYGLYDLIEKGYFERDTRVLAIHTGGLQGIVGFNERHKTKNLRILGG
uniref:Pyridoxal-phosphate dependent enzyme n=1 Tax=Roseihalotalea indica TaxID=2867963 RepID=A0AA49GU94_9BACT|nr:pyridoxal-phosphate dependent enzyme [Tunicatimonas sp. TK19036]